LESADQFFGPNNVTDLWHVKKLSPQTMEHLTAKPAELAVRAIQYSSRPGENVLDLFGGSGSTLIGCEQTAVRRRDCRPLAAIHRATGDPGRHGHSFPQRTACHAGKHAIARRREGFTGQRIESPKSTHS